MITRRVFLPLFIITSCLLTNCSDTKKSVEPEPTRLPSELTASEQQMAVSTTEFGFNMFAQVIAATPVDSNVFISPLSVAYALAMVYNGAAGETKEEIAALLRIEGLDDQVINKSFAGLMKVLLSVDPSVTTMIANAVWYTTHRTLVPQFGDICQTYYDATIGGVDFADPATCDMINTWAAENTNNKIKQVMQPPLDPSLVFILANAVYFKGAWSYPLDPQLTEIHDFHTSSNGTIRTPFMFLDSDEYMYDSLPDPDISILTGYNGVNALTMPYGDNWFRMTLLMPSDSQTIEQFIAGLTPEKWHDLRTHFGQRNFEAYIPKFSFSCDIKLNDILHDMGMSAAFQPGNADLSNMIEGGGVWLDKAVQKTFVQVDEFGTEAAAVTMFGGTTAMDPVLNFNRPFVFLIWERESGAVLFAGKVARPVWEEE